VAQARIPETADAAGIEAFGYKQELKRSLSLFDLVVYGLVFIIPTAPIALFGLIFNASHGMVPLIYVIGLVAMLFTALSYAAMSHAFPVAGSVYSYAARSLGPTIGFFAGWGILLDYLLLPAGTYVVCAVALHAVLPIVPKPLWVAGLVSVATLINYFGIETTARANLIMLGLQLAMLAVLIGVEIAAVGNHVAGAHLSLLPFYNPAELTPAILFGALSVAVVGFLGFDAVSTMAEESKAGPHAVGRATILSLCLAAFLFIVQSYLASLFVLDRTSFPPGEPTDAAFYGIVAIIGGYWLKLFVALPKVLFGSFAGAMTAQASTARLLYSMARDGKLPKRLAHIHPRRKVPDNAIFLVAIITLAIGVGLVDQLGLIFSMVSFGALIGFLLLHVSVIAHFVWRQKSRNWLRHLIVPGIGLAIVAYVLWSSDANAKIAGGIWLVVGLAIVLAQRAMARPAARA